MKTTLVLPDEVVQQLKNRCTEEGRSMSSIVEEALVRYLGSTAVTTTRLDLPSFAAGVPHVDVADRNALAALMDDA